MILSTCEVTVRLSLDPTVMIERLIHGNRSQEAFKESHEKNVETLSVDRRCETESKETHALKNAPKHTILYMKGLTLLVYTIDMFQMVIGDSCQCMKHTKQNTVCDIRVRHPSCTVQFHGYPGSGHGIEGVSLSYFNWKTVWWSSSLK
jgi:5-formaminoimidazole-4-carboxamide-1-beta-D-ribofuranosyl 5'-monophosphate synthetase